MTTRSGAALTGPRIALLVGAAAIGLLSLAALRLYVGNQDPNVSVPLATMPPRNAHDIFLEAAQTLWDPEAIDASTSVKPIGFFVSEQLKCSLAEKSEPALRMLKQGLSLPYQAPPMRSSCRSSRTIETSDAWRRLKR